MTPTLPIDKRREIPELNKFTFKTNVIPQPQPKEESFFYPPVQSCYNKQVEQNIKLCQRQFPECPIPNIISFRPNHTLCINNKKQMTDIKINEEEGKPIDNINCVIPNSNFMYRPNYIANLDIEDKFRKPYILSKCHPCESIPNEDLFASKPEVTYMSNDYVTKCDIKKII